MVIKDKDLGEIKLKKSVRARRITVRYKDGCYHLSYPPFASQSAIESSIEQMKPNLLKLKENAPAIQPIDEDNPFITFSFKTEIGQNSLTRYYTRLNNGVLYITYPQNRVCYDSDTQSTIRCLIEKAMRYEANRIFPDKVLQYAKQYGFRYASVSINKSRTRWGSCSSQQKINLSYYCMLLPEHLVDFIILHELCHTVEMNHGERFWNLLDKVSGGKSKELTRELKNYRTNW